ncbi:MAG: tetratricopeptide repeat protein [Planctomycetota bacterium]|jgi:tetratricopeptide (TPR) repeat protein
MPEPLTNDNLDDLWDFDDPAATETRFRTHLPAVAAGEDRDLHAELLTQIARTLSLRRQFDQAHALLDDAESIMPPETGRARIRLLLERGRTFNSAGDADAARPLFVKAWDLARESGADALAVDAAHMVAIIESGEQAMAWNLKALELASASPEPRAVRWAGSLHNNIGWTFHARGEFDEAMTHFEKALAARLRDGPQTQVGVARWCIARCLRSLEKPEQALAMQLELAANDDDDDGFIDEEIAECLEALGRGEEARPYFASAHAKLSRDLWLKANEPQRLQRLAARGGVEP